ncbi:MAG TPA: class II glutamine amidotransferase [Myxococcales bacterium]|nr:class II glutamine amidotransferase [Myxococcales bacterium]
MCRLFGCRSREASGVAHEMLHSANSLRQQSREHPDGWGLGWYEGGAPRVVRSLSPAHGDRDFEKLSQFVQALTVVAHVRKASIGRVAPENTHPFQRGPWLFAHNGTLPEWDRARPLLEAQIAPALLEQIRGETDSERCFHLFLTWLRQTTDAAAALAEAVKAVRAIYRDAKEPPSTTFLATDGHTMLACRSGRTLHLSTDGSYVALASEDPGEPPPGGRRKWELLPENALVSVDADLRVRVTTL